MEYTLFYTLTKEKYKKQQTSWEDICKNKNKNIKKCKRNKKQFSRVH